MISEEIQLRFGFRFSQSGAHSSRTLMLNELELLFFNMPPESRLNESGLSSMPEEFSLLQLQQGVEALAGGVLHKQNFRRLIEQPELVEETGQRVTGNAGRPAKLYRFRGVVILERAIADTKLPLARQPR